jgi:hypothetical protein
MSQEPENTKSDDLPMADLLESFRPGVDDLAAETWEKLRAPLATDATCQQRAKSIQRRDQVIHAAMHDVPIPADLAERLLAGLPLSSEKDVLSVEPPAGNDNVPSPTPLAQRSRVGRRTWIVGMVCGLSLAITAVVFMFRPARPTDSGEVATDDLARIVVDWESNPALGSSNSWYPVPSSGMLTSHPIAASDLAAPAPLAIGPIWLDGRQVVVYQLTRGPATARLYVAWTGSTFSVPRIPQMQLGVTAQRDAIAWQRGEYLYVVVVSGGLRAKDFVQVRNQA